MRYYFLLLVLAVAGCASERSQTDEASLGSPGFDAESMNGMPLVYETGFDTGTESDWKPATPDGWRIEEENGNLVLNQFVRETDFEPPVRSPFNRAILDDPVVEDFVFQARVKSTVEDYGHRDVVVLFGYRDDTHFYYVHFGKTADDQAHTIHIVNEAPRHSIATDRTNGTPWTDDWHVVRVQRDTRSGLIAAYFDDMTTPVMQAIDTTFTTGKIGLGTFDDTAMFDDIRIWGTVPK